MLGFWASTATGVSWALPMPSWTSVRSAVARAIGGEYGGSDGRVHLVPGSATRAGHGASGTRPGSAPGQLPAYSVKAASRTAMRTGSSPLAAHRGFDPKTSTFDARQSTAQQDVFENADGTTSVKDYQRPVNYRKPDGTWAKIDTKLVRRASGRLAQTADGAGASFADSAADPSLLSYSFAPGESVSFGLVGAAAVAPTVSGATAQYKDVLPQVSVDLEALPYGSKESLVLDSVSAARSFTYTMRLIGVTARLAADGSVQFVDGSGAVVGEVPRGSMTDANVAPASQQAPTSYGVSYALTSVAGASALTMTLDDRWLNDPSRVFPVTVDPTVIGSPDINASSSTYALNQGEKDNSADTVLKVGTCDVNVDPNCGLTVKSKAFLSFPNVGSTYRNDKIDSASLNLLDVWSEVCSAVAFDVAPVAQTWKASDEVQYPGYELGAQIGSASLAPGSACTNPNGAGTWMQVGLSTGIFNEWTTGAANLGLGIYAADTDGTWKKFASVNTANPPYLLLTYQANTAPSITGMNPPSGEALQNLTPELRATGWDPDGFPGKPLQYEFKVFDTASGTPVQVADSNTISSNNWVVPSGALKWSGTFTWQVRVYDQIAWGPWSYPSSLNPAIVQPTITSHLGATNGTKGYDPLTGNYTAQATDANLSTIGPALTVQRTYNSLDPRVGQAFGSGWSSVLDSQAAVDSDNSGNVVLTFANGQQVRFGKNGDGSFSPPAGMYATLSPAKLTEPAGSYCPPASDGYCLLDKTGTTYAYTIGGSSGPWQLSRVVDAQGRSTLYSYNASNQLSSMTSCVSGCQSSSPVLTRSLEFTWTPAATLGNGAAFAHVTEVKSNPVTGTDASTDLVWTYSYLGDRLTSVCDPVEQLSTCSNVTGYSYQTGSQFPAAVLDAGPQAYWRLADAANATSAADQVLANEGTDAGTPTNVTFGTASAIPGPSAPSGAGPLNTGATVASFNGTSSALTLPSSLVQNTTYLSIGLWFETNTSGSPQMLFSTGHSAVGTANPSSTATPVLYIGTDGKLYGHFWNGSTTAITSASPVNDGKWHYALLTAAGAQQWMYVDGAPAGSVSGQLVNVDPYDLVGAGVFSSAHVWPAGGSGNTWSYFHGQLADVAFFPHTLGSTTAAAIYAAGSHASALLTAIDKPSTAAQAAVTYDIPGNRVTEVVDSNGGSWQIGAPTVSGSSDVYASAVLGSSPEGYWRLQGSGDSGGQVPLNAASIANNEVTHHDVTVTGGGCIPSGVCLRPGITTYDPEGDGVFNNATLGVAGSSPFSDMTGAQFDGSSSYAQLPGGLLPTSGPAAIELWFKTNATTGMLFSDESATLGSTTGSMVANLYVGTDGKLYGGFYATSGKISMVSSGPVNNGAWHHVILSTDGSDQTLYLDGTQIGSSVSATPISQNSQPNVYVGAGTTGTNWPALPSLATVHFNGSISDVAVYRHALSGQDVAAHFAALKSSAGLTPVVSVQVINPLQFALYTTYDPMQGGRPLSSSDANGGTTRYGYDSGGFLNTVTDPLGDVTTTGHDVRGNEISKTVCQDQAAYQCSTSYTAYWPDDISATLSPDPRDDLRASTRDGRSASPSDPTYMTQYAYDGNGNVTAVTDPLGRKTISTYSAGTETPLSVSLDPSGAASCTTSSASGTIPAGLLISKKTPGGGTTSYAYYANGDLAQTTSPLGDRVIDVYDGIGRVLFKTECSNTYPNGAVTAYTYDGDGRTQTEVDPATTDAVSGVAHQKTTTTGYTLDGQIDHTVVSDTGGSASADKPRTTSYTYYPTGLVDTVTDPTGAVTTDSYDVEGNKTGEQDPNGDIWQYSYNGTGQRTSTVLTNYSGSISGVCQSASSGQLVKESRAYDLAGRLASVTDAMCRETAYTYFDNGLTATVEQLDPTKTDGSGITEAKTYDGAGHVLSDTKGNGTAVTLTTYDAAGQNVLTKVLLGNDSSGNAQYKNAQTSYDLDGRPSSVLKWQDGLTGVEQTDYIRDASGNVTSQIVHDSNAAQAQSASLAGAWPLNDGATTTARDGSGGNRPGTVSGWTGWSSDAPSGLHGSLWVDGVSGRVVAPSVPVDTSKDYSVSAWAKLAVTPGGNETIVSATGNNRGAFYLQYSKSTGGWSFLTTSADAATTTFYSATLVGAPAVGSWVHLVGVYNAESKTVSLYVNGALAQTAAASAAWTSAGGVDIGTYGGNFNGKIADVQLWNRTLSQTDVNQLYNRLSPGNQGLAGSWALDDGAATQGADSSPLGHPVSQTGGVWWNASHGGSAVLDGSSGYLSTGAPVLNTANSYTVGAWVNMNQPDSYATAVAQVGANMSAFYLQYSYSAKTWAFVVQGADSNGSSQATAYSSSLAPAWNTWVFLTGVYDASAKTATLFVNGAQVASVPVTETFDAGGPLEIGGVKTAGGALSNQVNGAVSGVSVYSKALTGGQISTLYAGGSLLAPNTTIKTHWTYDQRGMTTSMTAPMGNTPDATPGSYTTYYVSDELGRVTQVQQPGIITHVNGVASPDPVVPITWTGYDTFGDRLETEDPDGNITATAYNQDGQPTGTTLPRYTQPGTGGQTLTVSTHTDYNPDGTVKDTVDPAGNQTSYTYDQFGAVLTQTNPPISVNNTPTAGVTVAQYDQDGELTQVTDPAGAVTQTAYNYLGQKSAQTAVVRQPGNNPAQSDQATYTYDTLGDLTSVTTPTGVTTRTGYDDAGQRISATDGAGNVTRFSYDVDGRLKWTGNPDGSWLWNEYDLAGNLTWHAEYDHTSTLVRSQSAAYDLDGNISWASDFMGTATSFSYDADGNLTDQYEPTTASNTVHTSYGYDADGHRTQQTLGNNNTTIFTYNTWNLPESKIVPAAGDYTTPADSTYTTVYDLDGNPVTQSQPGGVSVSNTFDALGDLTRQSGTGANATSATRVLGYDLDGRLTSAATQNSSGSALTSDTFGYDDRGALLTAAGSSGASSFTYNADGQMATRTDASNAQPTSYGYDSAGRLLSVTDPLTGTTASYGYNTLDQVATINYGGASGDTRAFGYDNLHRLTSDTLTTATGAQVGAIDYLYNNDDQETEQDTYGIGTTTATTAVRNAYSYDLAGRLISWDNGTATTYYGYDADGNRTCVTTDTAGCIPANSTYQYNARDQLTADSTHTYAYAANGTPTGVTTTATSATEALTFDAYQQLATDGATAYGYDALGRTLTAGTTSLSYSGQGNQVAFDGTVSYTRAPDGTVTSEASGGYALEAWSDAHDNLVAAFEPAAGFLSRWQTYDPSGNPVSSSFWNLSLGYQSGYTSSGKVNMAARWYNPATGQFTSPDTQDNNPNPASVNANPYTYANDNPLTETDPSGHCPGCAAALAATAPGDWEPAGWIAVAGILAYGGWYWWDHSGSKSSSTSGASSTPAVPAWAGGAGDTWWNDVTGQADFTGQADDWWNTSGLNPAVPCTVTNSCTHTSTCPPNCKPLPPPPPPPPPLWLTTKNPNSASCKATGGVVCMTTTVGQANLPSIGGTRAFANTVAATTAGLSTALFCTYLRICGSDDRTRNDCAAVGKPTNAEGNIQYAPMQSYGPSPGECRPTEVTAHYTSASQLAGGTSADVDPPGWGDWNNFYCVQSARLHLLANQLGGDGCNPRNIVWGLQQLPNNTLMKSLENKTASAVKKGQIVSVWVMALYPSATAAVPNSFAFIATGSGGLNLDCILPNGLDTSRADRYKTQWGKCK